MRRLLAFLLPLILIAGFAACATTETDWARAQALHNDIKAEAIAYRRPCVVEGEDSPDCRITAADYATVDALLVSAQAVIDRMAAGGVTADEAVAALLDLAERLARLAEREG